MLLRIAARVELISLVLMVVNLATVHEREVSALLGPVHGCAYLLVVGGALAATRDVRARLFAVVPGIGGLLAVRRWNAADVSRAATGR